MLAHLLPPLPSRRPPFLKGLFLFLLLAIPAAQATPPQLLQPGTRYFHYNHRGDVIAMTDEQGRVVAELAYTAYGEIDSARSRNAESVRYRWGGHELDRATGLQYKGARYYFPELGRFVSADPAHQGASGYAALGDEPLAHVDPDGRYWIREKWRGYIHQGKTMTYTKNSKWDVSERPGWAKIPKGAPPIREDVWWAPEGSDERYSFLHDTERKELTVELSLDDINQFYVSGQFEITSRGSHRTQAFKYKVQALARRHLSSYNWTIFSAWRNNQVKHLTLSTEREHPATESPRPHKRARRQPPPSPVSSPSPSPHQVEMLPQPLQPDPPTPVKTTFTYAEHPMPPVPYQVPYEYFSTPVEPDAFGSSIDIFGSSKPDAFGSSIDIFGPPGGGN